MNHNGVISLPCGGVAVETGDMVKIDGSGEAVANTAANLAVGVVLHDVDPALSDQPVAVQLFSGGGIVNIKVTAAAIVKGAKVGYDTVFAVAKVNGTGHLGIALEPNNSAVGIIQVILN